MLGESSEVLWCGDLDCSVGDNLADVSDRGKGC